MAQPGGLTTCVLHDSACCRRVGRYILPVVHWVRGVAWRGTVVERRSLTGELSLSCARPAADG